MTTFLEVLVNGVSIGMLYALVALGFVMIFKATRVVNFAHASFIVFGAWVVAALSDDIGFWLALVVGLVAVAAIAVVVERVILARIDIRDHSTATIMTLAINILLIAEITRQLEESVVPVDTPWGNAVLEIGGVHVPASRIASMVAAVFVIAALSAMLMLSRWGLQMRATIQDPEAAALSGITMSRVTVSAWVVAALLAVVAGIGMASYPTPGVSVATQAAAFKAFPAAIIGGLDSFTGAIVGGILIGVAEASVSTYGSHLEFLGKGLNDVVAYALMIAILLWRPTGIFGSKELQRV
ncbi:MAG: branched-chain amino acid ABC transporter permease [Aeromicrobium sp.]